MGSSRSDTVPSTDLSNLSNIISEDQYYQIAGTRNVPSLFSYQSFANAVLNFKGFALSGDVSVAKREMACLLTHVKHEVSFQYTEQLCTDFNPNCRAKLGDKSMNFGRGPFQTTSDTNYADFSKYIFGDTRILQDPDMIIRDPNLFWQSGLFFYMTKLKEHILKNPPDFKMTVYRVCCWCCIYSDAYQVRGDTYRKICGILGVDSGPDSSIYAAKGTRLTNDPC